MAVGKSGLIWKAFGRAAAPAWAAEGVGFVSDRIGFVGVALYVKIVLNGGFVVASVYEFVWFGL
jgi:hypothetical protein